MDEEDRKKPFNDAMEHLTKIDGYPTEHSSLNKLPKPIRYLGYFFIGFTLVAFIMALIGNFLL
ncbi:hypothetical protein EV207_103152 [Scopulibacillus darangshiensis]|uniref:Amino acid transporter n=1 Tax=Scopulibacillus darangshiensis TaxID=442528 RepID=A0A4R2PA72_9BACL|nr:hypothetical protein [Scopulibacillus darangshiensis]TCP31268.1 hypothetical protein EV207_103152 [Scopulibacillus darangshiensis]